jgi:hypothetical protein
LYHELAEELKTCIFLETKRGQGREKMVKEQYSGMTGTME